MSRYRDRTYELCRLDQKFLKAFVGTPIGSKYSPQWSTMGETTYASEIQRTNNGLLIRHDNGEHYEVPITQTQVTYGERNWWQCPNTQCNRRCAILYLCRSYFVCRKCAKPAYSSQHDYKTSYYEWKVRDLRKRLWKDEPYLETDNLLESCHWWPKPKWMRWHTFNEKRAQVLRYEAKVRSMWQKIRGLDLSEYMQDYSQINEDR